MVRVVRVDLEANVGPYIRPVEDAKVKTEELDRKVGALDRDLNKIPADSAKAAAALRLLGDETGKAGVKLDDLGKRSTSMGAIDERIKTTRGEVAKLAEEFNRTGDAGILGKLFGAQGDLRDLERLRKRISGALEQGAADGGREGAKSFSSALQGTLSTPYLGPIVAAAIAGAVIYALPAINGALMGGAALGGIGLGVVGQLQDPKVKAALSGVGTDLKGELTSATTSFREPLERSARIFGDDLKQALASIDFNKLSKLLEPLASGVGGMIANIMPGLNKMFDSAGPILRGLAEDLPHLGDMISKAFDLMSRGGKGAQESLRLLVYALGMLAVAIGSVVLGASKLVEWLDAAGTRMAGAAEKVLPRWKAVFEEIKHGFESLNGSNDLDHFGRSLDAVASNAALTTDDLEKLSGALSKTTMTADTLQASMSQKLFSTIMDVDQAFLGWHKSLLDLGDTIKQNGLAIDRHTGLVSYNTQAGIANREAVLAAMTANMQQYQAFIAAGGAADQATAQYNSNTAALEGQLRKAGYSQKAIDDMIGSLKNVPGKVSADIAMHGLTDAVNNLGSLLAELNHLNGSEYGFTVVSRNVYESDYVTYRQGERGNRWGGIYQHAADGALRDAAVYSPSGPARYAFAEPATGGEAFVPRFGDYHRSTSILDQAARWYGGRFAPGGAAGGETYAPTYTIHVAALDARAAGPVVIEAIKSYERSNGATWRTAPGP